MATTISSSASNGRPYRSHKVPACHGCRRRKIGCKVDDGSHSCRHCLARNLQCSWPARTSGPLMSQQSDLATFTAPEARLERHEDSSPALVNRVLAEDIQVLERYVESSVAPRFAASSPYIQVSNTQGEPIVYQNNPRQRKGLIISSKSPGAEQREIIEQIMGTHKADVVHAYFEKIHPCFPILDEGSFWNMWERKADQLSHTLMCDIYAISIVYWSIDDRSDGRPNLDDSFIWNQAVIALRDDFMLPGMNTIHAALLDLLGRPVGWVAGNILNLGRTVTLAHSLGLHRNSRLWNIPEKEKDLRTRLWWGVLIHDRWSSLSHGTPPNICRKNFDVPLPSLASLGSARDLEPRVKSLTTFIHLCSLTEILGEILTLIYALSNDIDESAKNIRRIECALEQWEDDLPHFMNLSKSQGDSGLAKPNGVTGLWFYYLSLKLVLHRLALKITLRRKAPAQTEAESYRRALLSDAASTVIGYVLSLQRTDFKSFWLPYTSHMLVIATTIFMRCTIESKDEVEKEASISRLADFIAYLRAARCDFNWDLADFCLERCAKSVEGMIAGRYSQKKPTPRPEGADTGAANDAGLNAECESLEFPMLPYNVLDDENFIDYLWGPFWENCDSTSSVSLGF